MKLDKVQEAILSYETYKPIGTYGVTSLEKPRYWARLKKQYPDYNCLPLEGSIDSKIGTAFHTYAEEALQQSDLKVHTEVELKGDIAGYEVGGT